MAPKKAAGTGAAKAASHPSYKGMFCSTVSGEQHGQAQRRAARSRMVSHGANMYLLADMIKMAIITVSRFCLALLDNIASTNDPPGRSVRVRQQAATGRLGFSTRGEIWPDIF